MKGQTYWGRFVGGLIFLIALAAIQVLRIASSSVSFPAALAQYLVLPLVVLGMFGLVTGIYWIRGTAARKRRIAIKSDPSKRWICDLTTDEETFEKNDFSRTDRTSARSYALVAGPRGLELWGNSSEAADAVIPYARIGKISAPMNGSARGAGDFEIQLIDQADLAFHLISPRFAGFYPASPHQVDEVLQEVRDCVSSGRAPTQRKNT